jgi:hypothetical protein
MVPYSWWSPKRGSFSFGVRYARVEARQVAGPHGSVLVALINNTRETVKLPDATILPWYKPGWRILDLMTQSAQEIPAVSSPSIVLKPFDVRLYRYEK